MKFNKLLTILILILSFTWAIPMTIIGLFAAIVLMILGNKPKRFGPSFCFPITNGIGLNLGLVLIVPKKFNFKTNCHELGHHLQSCFFWGPLMPFVIAIPSVIRFWVRKQVDYEDKLCLVDFISLSILIVGCLMSLIGAYFHIFLLLLFGFLVIFYWLFIKIWLIYFELPKYKNKPYPSYYEIWFEKDASERGLKFIKKYYPEEDRREW